MKKKNDKKKTNSRGIWMGIVVGCGLFLFFFVEQCCVLCCVLFHLSLHQIAPHVCYLGSPQTSAPEPLKVTRASGVPAVAT